VLTGDYNCVEKESDTGSRNLCPNQRREHDAIGKKNAMEKRGSRGWEPVLAGTKKPGELDKGGFQKGKRSQN